MSEKIFNIQPKEITSVATVLKITGFSPAGGNIVEIGYTLLDADGRQIEAGVKPVPMSVFAALEADENNMINLEAANNILAGFGITAIEQIQ